MTGTALSSDHALEAFEAFAPYYDPFTAHHDYEAWTDTLLGLARANGFHGSHVLDVACGTGKSVLPLLARGLDVTACDHSPAMLALARDKTDGRARLHLLDARDLPVLGQFELITALSDIVNYMIDPSELVAMFRGMAANLAADGVVVFDANTLWMYGNFWADHAAADAGDAHLKWECLAGPDLKAGGLARAQLHVRNRRGQHTSLHYQRHHPRRVIQQALACAGLKTAAVCGQFPDGRLEPALAERRHSKAVYIAVHRSRPTERR